MEQRTREQKENPPRVNENSRISVSLVSLCFLLSFASIATRTHEHMLVAEIRSLTSQPWAFSCGTSDSECLLMFNIGTNIILIETLCKRKKAEEAHEEVEKCG